MTSDYHILSCLRYCHLFSCPFGSTKLNQSSLLLVLWLVFLLLDSAYLYSSVVNWCPVFLKSSSSVDLICSFLFLWLVVNLNMPKLFHSTLFLKCTTFQWYDLWLIYAMRQFLSFVASISCYQITDACSACFEQRTVFTQQVLAKALSQMVCERRIGSGWCTLSSVLCL